MHRIDILIPTRGRVDKLRKLLDSIPGQAFGVPVYARILIDGDPKTHEALVDERYHIVRYFEGHHGSVALRNAEAQRCEDAILWAVDDMEFRPGAIDNAVMAMLERFPDGDGVVGFVQEGQKLFHPTGVGLMGHKFLERYPGWQPFFPGYWLFAAQEIHWLCMEIKQVTGIDAFYQEPQAVIYHNHPCNHPEAMDQTHKDGRIHKGHDVELRKARMASGEIWGSRELWVMERKHG